MFGYQVILEVGGEKYDIVNCKFAFSQASDHKGQPQGEVCSGAIAMTYPNLPTNNLLSWMLNPRKYQDGVITTYNEDATPLQKLEFSQATCVSMKIEYQDMGTAYCNCQFTIVANKVSIGGVSIENEWPMLK